MIVPRFAATFGDGPTSVECLNLSGYLVALKIMKYQLKIQKVEESHVQ